MQTALEGFEKKMGGFDKKLEKLETIQKNRRIV